MQSTLTKVSAIKMNPSNPRTIKDAEFPLFKTYKKTQWLCMVEGATAPKVRHDSYKEAKDEAIRLAKVTGKPTYLLQILKKYDTEVTETSFKNVL